MTVHIGRITSEVSTPPAEKPPSTPDVTPWGERARVEAAIAAAERDRLRTSTGDGLD